MNKRLVFDGFVIALIVIIGTIITLKYEPILWWSAAFFVALPPVYLLLRGKFNYKKVFITAFISSLIIYIIDFLINASKGWAIPNEQLFLGWRIFWGTPVEEFLWFFFNFLFVILLYEHFVEREKVKKISNHFKYLITILIIVSIIVFSILFFTNFENQIKYVYLVTCSIYFLPPLIYVLIKNPQFIKKFFLVTIPFFLISLIHEITALKNGYWFFPGEYIGSITLFGLNFPFEEFFFYLVIMASSVLSYYELFFDDMK